jgi:HTH-type transcriptional regulator / antitoxin HigA
VKPIHSDDDYREALKRIDFLLPFEYDTPESEELYVLSLMVADYEDKHHAIEPPDPIELIKYKIDELRLRPAETYEIFGASSRMSEVLSGKRRLSLAMIRRIRERLGISADLLIPKDKKAS